MEEKKEILVDEKPSSSEEGKEGMSHKNGDSEKKKMKNLISIVILLAGLLVGSVFVDVAQFFGRQGVSPRALKNIDVFPLDGKTWVSFSEPVVNAQIVTDSACTACDPTEPLKWLKRVIPTMLTQKIDINSSEGQALVSKFSVKSIPAFIFDDTITKTDVYAQAQAIFTKKDNNYLMDTEQVGIKPGKYLELPQVGENDPQIGPKDAKVKIVLFSDFQCPYCKVFNDTFQKAIETYKDRVLFVYKFTPLDIHPQAENAAMAAACAADQGKFWEMSDKLYASQSDWQGTTGTAKFKTYAAALGLKAADFNQCLDGSKMKDKIEADKQQAADFGISGTPAFFVNDQFSGGLVSPDDFNKMIDDQLAK